MASEYTITSVLPDSGTISLADKLHIKTRQSVIRRQLLFRSGDPYSRHAIDESARARAPLALPPGVYRTGMLHFQDGTQLVVC